MRIIGLNSGGLYGTSTGSSALVNLDAGNVIPSVSIARTIIDPNSQTTAYVTLSAFGVNNVWKTTNLNAASPTWISASSGIPQIPVDAIIVDPSNSSKLYVGTDIGVYISNDGGATWLPFGTGLPTVAVFGLAITSGNKLRIATHGRGMWQTELGASCTITLTSPAGTNSQTLCANTSITNITYSTTLATSATFSNLPAGVTGNWASDVVTISGTPTVPGTYNYLIILTGGCGSASGTITVNPLPIISAVANPDSICSGGNSVYCPEAGHVLVLLIVLNVKFPMYSSPVLHPITLAPAAQ